MSKQQVMHIGLDDTDSTKGGCTTYLAALLIERLERFHVEFIDYPNLIRLNPNVPGKQEATARSAYDFGTKHKFEEQIVELATDLWEEYSAIKEKGTDPGIVFLTEQEIPENLRFSRKKPRQALLHLKRQWR